MFQDLSIAARHDAPLPLLERRVGIGALLAAIVGWLCLDILLQWRFMGTMAAWPYLLAGCAILGICRLVKVSATTEGPPLRTLLACLLIALTILMIGGEGRFFYANLDWQVRDAALHDMALHPWPFLYEWGGQQFLLRTPVGMHLVPALVGKVAGQPGSDLALLIQNSALLGAMLAIGSTLFRDSRSRLIALATFLMFSGLDIVGQIVSGDGAFAPTAHLEGWAPTQFSAVITQAFWVPNHAIAGWLCALAFLLWRVGKARLGVMLALVPLLALWSPLGAMGSLPFVLYAAARDAIGGKIERRDILLPLGATLLSIPTLLYLGAAPDAVGARIYPLTLKEWALFEGVEIVPFLVLLAPLAGGRFGGATLVMAALCLLLMPFVQIGWSIDFAMRASIPALAVITVQIADALTGNTASRRRKIAFMALLGIGSVTPLSEIARSLTFGSSPPPRCDVINAWNLSFSNFPLGTYLAPLDDVPAAIRPRHPAIAQHHQTTDCFARAWAVPPLFKSGAAAQPETAADTLTKPAR